MSDESVKSVASEMTFTWGRGEKYRSIRRIALDVIGVQTELIGALQRESRDREVRFQCVEMERDQNAERIEALEQVPTPPTGAPENDDD
jgi:hypothetical protein